MSKSPSHDTVATAADDLFEDKEETEFEDDVEEKHTQVLLGQATLNTKDTHSEENPCQGRF